MIWTHPLEEMPAGKLTWATSGVDDDKFDPCCWYAPAIVGLEDGSLTVIRRDKSEEN
jgi:hypothetical protein